MHSSLSVGHESCRGNKKVLNTNTGQQGAAEQLVCLLFDCFFTMPPILLGTILSLIFLVFHSVKAGSNYVDLQAASSIAPGWIADGATNNNGGQILAPFSNEQISESLFTSDNACASPDKSQTHVRRGRRRGRRGAICPNLAPSPLQGTEQGQQQPNGKLGDGNTDSSTESFQSPNPGSQQPSGKVPAWPKIEPNREKCDHDSINIPVCDSMQNSEVAATSSSIVLYNLPKCSLCTCIPNPLSLDLVTMVS